MIRLSICIPTVVGREAVFQNLHNEIKKQIERDNLSGVQVIVDKDNKEVSIGAKRDRMYKNAKGLFTVQIDDDDMVPSDYVSLVYGATFKDVDCIGYKEHCIFEGGREAFSDFSLKHKSWITLTPPIDGISHYRTPFCKTPIRTDICKRVGVKDMRFAEDHDFAMRVYPFLKKEHYINKVMYIYRYKSEDHKKKYGITR